ncbi:hypothetical protein E2C01_087163 [Portunus trituberculatus]|uniref:Uncharacterized protein n=1 Tax=Portunus trituberculatus TaxID=210409 RepID=A0A5B7J2M0_PORTR|nr:hypothetical protein [Portunus trituberculatus]
MIQLIINRKVEASTNAHFIFTTTNLLIITRHYSNLHQSIPFIHLHSTAISKHPGHHKAQSAAASKLRGDETRQHETSTAQHNTKAAEVGRGQRHSGRLGSAKIYIRSSAKMTLPAAAAAGGRGKNWRQAGASNRCVQLNTSSTLRQPL